MSQLINAKSQGNLLQKQASNLKQQTANLLKKKAKQKEKEIQKAEDEENAKEVMKAKANLYVINEKRAREKKEKKAIDQPLE